MDYVTIANLSADPSWRSDQVGMDKQAAAAALRGLGAVGGWGKRLWGGMRSQRNLNRAKGVQDATVRGGQPWYQKLKFWNKPKAGPADFANPAYRGAGAALRPVQKGHEALMKSDGLARAGSRLYQGGKHTAGFAGAASTPLSLAWMGGEPIRNTRNYAHGYTDASTRVAEELSNTPWWKIMGMGLGKMADPDIVWNKLVSPVADRGVWDTFKNALQNGGWRDALRASTEVMGAREMLQKRDLQRRLKDDPDMRQSIIDQIVDYQKSLMDAQAANQIES